MWLNVGTAQFGADVDVRERWEDVGGGASESGPHWSAMVTNPTKPGDVSLRVQGTDSAGFTASATVINAYAVS
jgi:hypothetical protein